MKLTEIQNKLKAPKSQFNKFGNYKYRNCEDILEAVKPLLKGCTLVLTDEIVLIGERYYVKAVVSFTDNEGNHSMVQAYAREPESKKGMDASQITGAASSYARKYALNGLFLIDDTRDADTQDNRSQGKQSAQKGNIYEPLEKLILMGKASRDMIYKYALKNYNKEPYKLDVTEIASVYKFFTAEDNN